MSDYDSVEGVLCQDKHGFSLKDALILRRVWVWSNIMLDDYIGKRISLSGDLDYDNEGNVTAIDHYHEINHSNLPFVFKDDSELPSANDVRGILSGGHKVMEIAKDEALVKQKVINNLKELRKRAECDMLPAQIACSLIVEIQMYLDTLWGDK